MFCTSCGSNKVEANNLCASCAHDIRKSERNELKVKVVKSIRKVSPQMAKKLSEYEPKKRKHLSEHPECQVKLIDCEFIGVAVHHAEPRATGLNKEESFLTVCTPCHDKLHNLLSADERRQKGFLK